jgi:hypothetical protein
MNILFPSAGKINGGWLQPNPAAVGAVAATHHHDLWALWDWDGWVKPQLDHGMAIGINTFSAIGDLYGVANGSIPIATYRAMQLQIATYLAEHGAYYMPCCANTIGYINYSLSAQDYAEIALDYLLPLQSLGNIPGVFVFDEPHASTHTYQYIIDCINAIRAGGCALPMSCPENYDQTAWISGIESAMDFYSIGTATFPTPSTLLDTWLLNTSKEVLISTTYKNQEATAGLGGGSPATVVADLKTVYNLAYSGHPRIKGVLQWGVADYGNSTLFPANPAHYQWGVIDTSTTPGVFAHRQHKTWLISQYSRGSVELSKKV